MILKMQLNSSDQPISAYSTYLGPITGVVVGESKKISSCNLIKLLYFLVMQGKRVALKPISLAPFPTLPTGHGFNTKTHCRHSYTIGLTVSKKSDCMLSFHTSLVNSTCINYCNMFLYFLIKGRDVIHALHCVYFVLTSCRLAASKLDHV